MIRKLKCYIAILINITNICIVYFTFFETSSLFTEDSRCEGLTTLQKITEKLKNKNAYAYNYIRIDL